MDKHIDRSLSGLRYTMAIMGGKNRQVLQVVEHVGGTEKPIVGDFVLTIGRSAVVLTCNRDPVIVKRWTPRAIESYLNESNASSFLFAGVQVAEVYQDSDGWIWEGIVDDEGNHFNVIRDGEYLYTISFD